MEVFKVEPVVEKRESFNGYVNRRVAVAKDMTQDISAILFTMSEPQNMGFYQSDGGKLLIGNLNRDAVEELMDSLLINGYADLSGYSYQSGNDVKKLKFDNGKSNPYCIRGFEVTMGMEVTGVPNVFAPVTPTTVWEDQEMAGEEFDDESDDVEQLRAEIYSLSDKYTITQLANMEKDELSDILKGIESGF